VSEIEFRTPYVVAERWIVARMLRFMHAKNVHSDTLRSNPSVLKRWGYFVYSFSVRMGVKLPVPETLPKLCVPETLSRQP
jgi:hypothetical protein